MVSLRDASPISLGVVLGLLSAVAFGITTPIIARMGAGMGPFTTAALLYGGAAVISLALRTAATKRGGRPLVRRDLPAIAFVAVLGGAVAPVLLAVGIARTGGVTASLALNLEAIFTMFLAWLIHKESLGRQAIFGAIAMLGGGALLAIDTGGRTDVGLLGLVAVTGATIAWASDNTFSRSLSDADPSAVVLAKGAIGAVLTTTISLIIREPLPALSAGLAILACGATGYGLSLRLYLLAQQRMGAGRTASVFAAGPFIGAVVSWLAGDRAVSLWLELGALAFALGVYLHVTERHRHPHRHDPMTHEHLHRHDDGHHDHVHQPLVEGEHTHRHDHRATQHTHDHAPDLHHTHEHE